MGVSVLRRSQEQGRHGNLIDGAGPAKRNVGEQTLRRLAGLAVRTIKKLLGGLRKDRAGSDAVDEDAVLRRVPTPWLWSS